MATVGGRVTDHHAAGVERETTCEAGLIRSKEAGIVDDGFERLVVAIGTPHILSPGGGGGEVVEQVLVGLDFWERVAVEVEDVDVDVSELTRRRRRAALVDVRHQIQAPEWNIVTLVVVERDHEVPVAAGAARIEVLETREHDFVHVVAVDVSGGDVCHDRRAVDFTQGRANQTVAQCGVAGLGVVEDEVARGTRVRAVGLEQLVHHHNQLATRVVVQIAARHRKLDLAVGHRLRKRRGLAREVERAFVIAHEQESRGRTERKPNDEIRQTVSVEITGGER